MFSKFYELMLVLAILNQQVFLTIGKVAIRGKIGGGGGEMSGQCWLPWQTRQYIAFPYVQRESGWSAFWDATCNFLSGGPPCRAGEEYSWTPPGCYSPTPPSHYCWGPLCQLDVCDGAFTFKCKLPPLCALGAAALALINVVLAGAVFVICSMINFMCTADGKSCALINVVSLFVQKKICVCVW